MGITRFNETWWTWGHETFGAHEEGGLLKTHAPFFKGCLLPQGNFKFIKPTINSKQNERKKIENVLRDLC
jgi:hypothetical protein